MSLPESSFDELTEESFAEEAPVHRDLADEARSDEPRGVLVRKPRTNIYAVLLGISAAAIAVGCLLLVLEIWQYGPPWTFPWKIPANLR